jgi:hypothetical protein
LDKLETLSGAQKANLLTDMFGAEYQDDMSKLVAGLDHLKGNFDLLNDSARAGSMEKEFAAKMKLTSSSIDGVKQSAVETSISLGQVFLPSIVQIAGGFQGAAMHLATFRQEYPALTDAIVLTAAGLVGFRLAWLGTTFIMEQYKATAAGVRLMIASQNAQMVINRTQMLLTGTVTRGAAIAQWLLNTAMSANPITLMIGAIVLLGGGLYLLYQNFEGVRNIIDSTWQKFAETFPNAAAILQGIGEKISWVTDKFKSLVGWQQASQTGGDGSSVAAVTAYPHATGGIFNRPHLGLVAEAGYPEAVIPINNSARARSLYQQTGELLGMNSGSEGPTIWQKAEELGRTMNNITITFAPVIHGANSEEIRPVLQQEKESFFEEFQEMMHNQGRRSYG